MSHADFNSDLVKGVLPRGRAILAWMFGVAAWGMNLALAETPAIPHYVGTLSCSSIACHGRTEPRQAAGTVARNEFAIWMQSDPHARSTQTIWSEEFERILSRLGAVRDNAWDTATYARCARCHDPLDQSSSTGIRIAEKTFVSVSSIQPRGIGCESCHGAAGNWLAKHYERGIQPSQLAALGMKTTRNLLVRGQVCASCHVGSAENDMNHDMIAAGHPALRFEVASYHDRLAKHWPASDERLMTPDFQAQLWAAGQLASADAALGLLRGRAARAAKHQQWEGEAPAEPGAGPRLGRSLALPSTSNGPTSPWPEFSEYSCLSCHQRLRTADESQALRLSGDRTRPPGQPKWNPWFAVVPVRPDSIAIGELSGSFLAAWQSLQDRMQPLSTANAQEILGLIPATRSHLKADLSFLNDANVRNRVASFSNRDLTRSIRVAAPRAERWEAVCQLFLALQAAHRGYQDVAIRRLATRGVVGSSQQHTVLPPKTPWLADLESMRWSLAFAENTDVPRAMLKPAGTGEANAVDILPGQMRRMTLDEIRRLAVQLAEQIDAQTARLEALVGK